MPFSSLPSLRDALDAFCIYEGQGLKDRAQVQTWEQRSQLWHLRPSRHHVEKGWGLKLGPPLYQSGQHSQLTRPVLLRLQTPWVETTCILPKHLNHCTVNINGCNFILQCFEVAYYVAIGKNSLKHYQWLTVEKDESNCDCSSRVNHMIQRAFTCCSEEEKMCHLAIPLKSFKTSLTNPINSEKLFKILMDHYIIMNNMPVWNLGSLTQSWVHSTNVICCTSFSNPKTAQCPLLCTPSSLHPYPTKPRCAACFLCPLY